ncbi:formylglycine-generating enzyme family protein [Luteolibacter marinus]|uniref:formylglycine-generating enzyme family protein n=1 Tax=Luteolibacter marinus TaxID=2776705 RepID=UPI001866E55F|nr:SUMF1/EgtB/PvdO family nonheme iron enzyme [Luteolibacter marinus]
MLRPLLVCLPLAVCRADDALPKPDLLPTTRAIHEAIAKAADPAAEAMKPYTEKVPQTEDATLDLVVIPGGEFTIGSPEAEEGRLPDEGPQRKLKIEPFWMAKVETTWALYQPFMENQKSRNKDGTLNRDGNITTSEPPERKDGETLVDVVTQPTPPYVPMNFGMGDGYAKDCPAVGVTQHAASKFCEWLSAQTGHFYRLPTEAEWEYACRAGTTTAYGFGDDPAQLGDYAWLAENSDFQYQAVGGKKPNAWGLFDMHGNVAELCLGQYAPDAYAALKDGDINPWTVITKRYPTVVRGGSWNDDPDRLRSAARLGSDPAWKMIDPQLPKSLWYFTNAPWLGFRVVRPLKTPPVEEMHRYWNMDGDTE